jgi:hypothetical protein
MYDELKGIWKGAVITTSRYYPSICLEGLRESCHDIRCPGRDSNRALPENESSYLPLCQPVRPNLKMKTVFSSETAVNI